jgi:hypothetical protein
MTYCQLLEISKIIRSGFRRLMAAPVKKKELVIECLPVPVADIRIPARQVPSLASDCFASLHVWSHDTFLTYFW